MACSTTCRFPSARVGSLLVTPMLLALIAASGCDRAEETAGAGATASGATQTDAELDAPIATIDGETITVRDFQDRINQQTPYVRARYNSIEQRKQFLESIVRYEVLAREAYRRGYDKDPEAVRAMKTVMIQQLMKGVLEGVARPENVPEADLRAYYDAHPGEWNKPEEVRVSAIALATKAAAQAIEKQVKGPEGKTNKGFRDLVVKHSIDDAGRLRGGDLRYFARPGDAPSADPADGERADDDGERGPPVPAPVATAAFALARTGDVAGPIDGGDGRFYFIKQTGRRKAVAKSFEQVRRQIQNALWKERRSTAQSAFVDDLKQKAKIEVFADRLAAVRVAPPGAGDLDGSGHGRPDAIPAVSPTGAP